MFCRWPGPRRAPRPAPRPAPTPVPTTGGVLASFASLGQWTSAEPGALVGFLGALVAMPETHPPEARVAAKSQTRWAALRDTPRRKALGLVLALFFAVFLAMTTLQVAFALLVQARLGWGTQEVPDPQHPGLLARLRLGHRAVQHPGPVRLGG